MTGDSGLLPHRPVPISGNTPFPEPEDVPQTPASTLDQLTALTELLSPSVLTNAHQGLYVLDTVLSASKNDTSQSDALACLCTLGTPLPECAGG